MAGGAVRSVIYHFYVVDGIGDKVIQYLVIRLCREFERSFVHHKMIVKAGNEVNGTLASDFVVEAGHSDMVHRCRVSQFLKKRRLIVKSRCKA